MTLDDQIYFVNISTQGHPKSCMWTPISIQLYVLNLLKNIFDEQVSPI